MTSGIPTGTAPSSAQRTSDTWRQPPPRESGGRVRSGVFLLPRRCCSGLPLRFGRAPATGIFAHCHSLSNFADVLRLVLHCVGITLSNFAAAVSSSTAVLISFSSGFNRGNEVNKDCSLTALTVYLLPENQRLNEEDLKLTGRKCFILQDPINLTAV